MHRLAEDNNRPTPTCIMQDKRSSLSQTDSAFDTQRFEPFAASEMAISEANHRISNNLALLASTVSMRAASYAGRDEAIAGQEVAATLHEITARIATVGHLHRLLSTEPAGTQAQFGPHLRELCRLFISVLAEPGEVELVDGAVAECLVSADHFLPLSLIVTEVVTNALKYSHPAGAPGTLVVGCRCEADGTIVIEIADNGVGLPEGFEPTAQGGTGMRMIYVLAQQIDAEVGFDSRPTGLRFSLRLPASGGR